SCHCLLAFLVNHVATKGVERTKELGERMAKLKTMSSQKDDLNSETYKDISKMKMTYDPKLKSVADIDGQTGVGRVGDGFFKLDPYSYSAEMTGPQIKQYMAMSTEDRQIFVLRHEAEHMSLENMRLQERYAYTSNIERRIREDEQQATSRALEWMK
ncbi:MAG: hypothetical protein U5M23_07260, partial [Marinagarivorans sp.]|nr:hypothetical protein [Marinagarivorans sp.]